MVEYVVNINTGRIIMVGTQKHKQLLKLGQVAPLPELIPGENQNMPCTNARLLLIAKAKELAKAEQVPAEAKVEDDQKRKPGRPKGTTRDKVIDLATDIINQNQAKLKNLDQKQTEELITKILYSKLFGESKAPPSKKKSSKFKIVKHIPLQSDTDTVQESETDN